MARLHSSSPVRVHEGELGSFCIQPSSCLPTPVCVFAPCVSPRRAGVAFYPRIKGVPVAHAIEKKKSPQVVLGLFFFPLVSFSIQSFFFFVLWGFRNCPLIFHYLHTVIRFSGPPFPLQRSFFFTHADHLRQAFLGF